MDRFNFWQKWLYYSSILFALFGIFYACFADNALTDPYHSYLARIFFRVDHLPYDAERLRQFVAGPTGGTIAATYILTAYIAKYPFKQKEIWARNALVFAFGIWFIVDSSVSVYNGVYLQFWLINILSLLIKALPIAFTWKDFKQEKKLRQIIPLTAGK